MSATDCARISDLSIVAGGQTVVDGLDLSIPTGARVGLIGESGSGKSLTALSLMGLVPPSLTVTGTIEVAGVTVSQASDRQMQGLRGKDVSMVFQEPMTSLNPLMPVGKQLQLALQVHGGDTSRVEELLDQVGLDQRIARAYPYQLSGGQRQRILLAMAFAHRPRLLICDEPTTALDATVQKTILDLIQNLVDEYDTSLLFISHDLAVVSRMADSVVVLKEGTVVERGDAAQVLASPQHEYTKALVDAFRVPEEIPVAADADADELVRVEHVSKVFKARRSLLSKPQSATAVDDVSVSVRRGQRLGIVGESGSGKTTLLKLMSGLESPTSGCVTVAGQPVTSPRSVSSVMQLVFQDPKGSFDPTLTVGTSIEEPLLASKDPQWADPAARRARVREVLEDVGLDPEVVSRRPDQFSGGQRQRMSIARALTVRPDVLIADEPVSALDVSVRSRVLDLLDSLVRDKQMTLIMVSHDLSAIRHVCDSVVVLKDGRIVEQASTADLFAHPQHPYTRTLLEAIPVLQV